VTNNLVLAQEAVPHLREQGGGSIVFVASTAGTAALEEHLPYGVAKAALIHMAAILAVQLGPANVRVNTVSPGVIAARGLDAPEWSDGERAAVVTGPTPLGRPGTPDEIAGCVVWLASPSGAFATGKDFVVDGGQTLKGMEGPHEYFELMRRRRTES
jgi:NAD(P)-dependent dehydrogenase (short-subunit alcohol dehydrogenase family)